MNKRFIAFLAVFLIIMALVGFGKSNSNGIQPGYFEKAEAPAYGVGGEEKIAAGMEKEFQDYYRQLSVEEEE